MKGSFLVKASDLLNSNSIFHGAIVVKIDGKEYVEKGVLFLTPKGFNIRFLLKTRNMPEAKVFTVFLGTSFNNNSLKYFEEGLEETIEGIFCFNFDLGKNKFDGRENYHFTKYSYPANKLSFYYESSLAKNSFKVISEWTYGQIEDKGSISFVFDLETIIPFINLNNWTSILVSASHLEKGYAKIDQSLQVNTVNSKQREKSW